MTRAIPFYGIYPFVFGRSRDEIRSMAGDPDAVNLTEHEEAGVDENWKYTELGIEVVFSDDDEWRLTSVQFFSGKIQIEGLPLVGVDIERLPELVKRIGIDDLKQTDDFGEFGVCFESDANGLMFWAIAGKVDNITLFPRYDASGNIPLWPDS